MKCNSHSFAERLMRNDAHESEIKMKSKKTKTEKTKTVFGSMFRCS